MTIRADARAAVLELLDGCAAAQTPVVKLATYPGRPASIAAPHAFIDQVSEGLDYPGPLARQRSVTVEAVLLHGLFDSKEAVNQADVFMDALVDYVAARREAAGANRTIGITSIADEPSYVADWIRGEQKTYYATRVSFEAYEGD